MWIWIPSKNVPQYFHIALTAVGTKHIGTIREEISWYICVYRHEQIFCMKPQIQLF
jgi:hypothetical protein